MGKMIPPPPIIDGDVTDEDIRQDFIEYLYSFNFLAEKEPDAPTTE